MKDDDEDDDNDEDDDDTQDDDDGKWSLWWRWMKARDDDGW